MNKVVTFSRLEKTYSEKVVPLESRKFSKMFQMSSDCLTNVIAISKIGAAGQQTAIVFVVFFYGNSRFFSAGGTKLRADHFQKFEIAINFITQSLDI